MADKVTGKRYRLVEGTHSMDRGNGLEFFDVGDTIEGLTENQVKAMGDRIKPLKGKGKASESAIKVAEGTEDDEDSEESEEVTLEAVEDEDEEEEEREESEEGEEEDEPPYTLGTMSIPDAVKSVASMDLPTASENYKEEKSGLNRSRVTKALATRIKTLKGQK